MSYTRPTLSELLSTVSGDLAGRTEGQSFVRREVEKALGFCVAGIAHMLHGHLAWVRDQLFPQTADLAALAEWGDWLGVPRKAGARAAGVVSASGTGTYLPEGTLLTAGSARYRVGAYLGWGGKSEVSALDYGTASNLDEGEPLTLVSPVAGIASVVVDYPPISGGADEESAEEYRPRVLAALRAPAFSGARGDYARLALSLEGVTRAWEYPMRMGPGSVSLTFAMDGRDDPIPLEADLSAMFSLVTHNFAPADMLGVEIKAPIRDALQVEVSVRGEVYQSQIEDALRTFLKTDAQHEQPLPRSLLDEAISSVPGEISHTITRVTAVARGVSRELPLNAPELVPVTWGLFTFGSLVLTELP